MLNVEEARNRLLAALPELHGEEVPLDQAAGRVLVQGYYAPVDLPPFSNSSMDGFAVRAANVQTAGPETPILLDVIGDIAAGSYPNQAVQPGQAMRIMTGAHLPNGADSVVPVEDTDFGVREAGVPVPPSVKVFRAVDPGAYIRLAGEDLKQGDLVLPAGLRLRPQDVAMLATLGQATVKVHRRPVVAILSTGDELLPVEAELAPGKIRESNAYALAGQLASCGALPLPLGIVPDQKEAVAARLTEARAREVDLIISSAGVSVGAFDFVRDVVVAHGSLNFWRVNMRPGKPLAFGHYFEIPFVGLPGNPVSAFVGFEVFLRPAMHKMVGDIHWRREVRQGVLAQPVESDGRESYLRGVVKQDQGFESLVLTGHQGSGNLFSLIQANALIVVPAGVTFLPAGAQVDYWPL